jgi:CheY-like chemotaxis protein
MDATADILIVDDDASLRAALQDYLSGAGYAVRTADSGAAMDARLAEAAPDLVVLDVMMPGEDGLSICRRLQGRAPVLMLSAMGETTDRIVGLEVGAADYLPKPFEPRELLARVRAVLRRPTLLDEATDRPLIFEGWTLEVETRRLTDPAGAPVELTGGRVRPAADLPAIVWAHPQPRSDSGEHPRAAGREFRPSGRSGGQPPAAQAGPAGTGAVDRDGARGGLSLPNAGAGMSIRSLSIRTLAAGFTVAAILLSLTVAFVIALAFPAPPPARVTLAEAEAAVTGDAETGWRRRVVAAPPFKAAHEGQALVAQAGLAVLLDAEVRVRPLSPERAPAGGPSAPSGPPSERLKALLTSMALSPGMSFCALRGGGASGGRALGRGDAAVALADAAASAHGAGLPDRRRCPDAAGLVGRRTVDCARSSGWPRRRGGTVVRRPSSAARARPRKRPGRWTPCATVWARR